MAKDLKTNISKLRTSWHTSGGRVLSYGKKYKINEVFNQIGLSAYFASVSRAINFKDFGIDKKTRQKLKEDAASYLSKEVKKIYYKEIKTDKEFDKWMKKTSNKIIGLYSAKGAKDYTLGNAQKLINIAIKYLLSSDSSRRKNTLFKHCHIPIDSIIQKELFKYPFNIKQLSCPWSKLNNWNEYMRYQNDVRNKAKQCGYESPIACEIDIWP